MSKVKNGGLDQYGAEPFEQQQFGTDGVEGVNSCREQSCRWSMMCQKERIYELASASYSEAMLSPLYTFSRAWTKRQPRTCFRFVSLGLKLMFWGSKDNKTNVAGLTLLLLQNVTISVTPSQPLRGHFTKSTNKNVTRLLSQ